MNTPCPTTQPSPYDYEPPCSDVIEELEAINALRNELFQANIAVLAKKLISKEIKLDFLEYLAEAIDETIKLKCVNGLHIRSCDLREETFASFEGNEGWTDLVKNTTTDDWVIV
jgi:hypothetical protein